MVRTLRDKCRLQIADFRMQATNCISRPANLQSAICNLQFLAISLLLLLCVNPARAQSALPPVLRQVGFDQRLNAQVPLDLMFNDEAGQPVKLEDYFSSKPVILVLAYYRCPMLCTQVLNGLVQALLDITFDIGKE